MSRRQKVQDLVLYAWVGEDELGSGHLGLKQGLVPAGMIPLVSVEAHKLQSVGLIQQLSAQAARYGKTLHLCKFVFAEEVCTVVPASSGSRPVHN